MITTHTLGFPRVGEDRELKFGLEQYWRGEITDSALKQIGLALRARHWALQRDAGLDYVTVGDFAFYDHVAQHIQWLGCTPPRFLNAHISGTDTRLGRYFLMARGSAGTPNEADCRCASSQAVPALEMTKWFDTNYHYLVPEFLPDTVFQLDAQSLFTQIAQAQALEHPVKVALIGPLTFLWLGKEKAAGFARLDLLDSLLPVYSALLKEIAARKVDWIQIDEPILGLDLPQAWRNAFEPCYTRLASCGANILLSTYFSPLQENLRLACQLPVAGLHLDAVRAPEELQAANDWLPAHKVLSVGMVDGRNIWRSDLDAALITLQGLYEKRPHQLWLAPSCSLLHLPYSLERETQLAPEIKSWLAFALEKLQELRLLKSALLGETDTSAFADARSALAKRKNSKQVHDTAVQQRIANLPPGLDQRPAPFEVRQQAQQARLSLPCFPTTTIGSFPQIPATRAARAKWKRGEIDNRTYENAIRAEIAYAIEQQEMLGLDVLVHGEAERNDMVEYFGEQLRGFAFTQYGWVQSYGSRCVKPPLIFGDISRPAPMTVAWTVYAQSLTQRPVKGMLTGPVTILQWSFVRDDVPRAHTALQIALAIRDEVADLEQAGVAIIQIDEPALREGLPLRRAYWKNYFDWATRAFRVAAGAAGNATQIHTHMCYADFNDILPQIAALDADVITLETSRSDMEILRAFGGFAYPNAVGPGVYDIHSPQVPEVGDMVARLESAGSVIPPERLWVNPDCGLKTRGWNETRRALQNMVDAARQLRHAQAKPVQKVS